MGKPRKKAARVEAEQKVAPPQQTWELHLTRAELEHLRDLFSVRLPIDMQMTVSQSLSAATGKPTIEAILWERVHRACTAAKVPLEHEAPDFVVGLLGAPPLGVFQVAADTQAPTQPTLNQVFPDEKPE